jgi:hypothetical protein
MFVNASETPLFISISYVSMCLKKIALNGLFLNIFISPEYKC